MNSKINYYIVAGVFVLMGIGIGLYHTFRTKPSSYELQVLKVEGGGYGYKIIRDEKTIIYQPFIPGEPTKKPFACAGEARRVGAAVKKRLETGKSVSISAEDLKKMQISGYINSSNH